MTYTWSRGGDVLIGNISIRRNPTEQHALSVTRLARRKLTVTASRQDARGVLHLPAGGAGEADVDAAAVDRRQNEGGVAVGDDVEGGRGAGVNLPGEVHAFIWGGTPQRHPAASVLRRTGELLQLWFL